MKYQRGPLPAATIPPRRQPDPDAALGAHPEHTAIHRLVCPHSWSCQLLVGRSPEGSWADFRGFLPGDRQRAWAVYQNRR